MTPDAIAQIVSDPDGLDFDTLRRKGIAMLQQLCGDRWTDYNLHDPGVTILEQFCYALTDLAYRSEFAAEDYLAGAFGQIDYRRHGLHRADQIFPSQVLTAQDYRKILYDGIAEIEDVWVSPAEPESSPAPACAGLYRIVVKLRDKLQSELDAQQQAQLERRVLDKVRTVFLQHRNLGEDLDTLEVIDSQPVFLCGDIQIHSLRDPAAILADLFFRCARQLSSGFRSESYSAAHAGGMPLENLFDGPQTVHGRIVDAGPEQPGTVQPMARLIAQMQAVDGVVRVQRLGLCDENGAAIDLTALHGKALRLRFPREPQSGFLTLQFASGNTAAESGAMPDESDQTGTHLHEEKILGLLEDARVILRKMRFESDTLRNAVQPLEQIAPAPQGVPRSLQHYYSIQHQFPAIYGISRTALPSTASLAHQVGARQLKAYLYIGEQIMANYLQNLQSIPQVFSTDARAQTYFSQLIDGQSLPAIETLYVEPPERIATRLDEIVQRIDRPEKRRSRLADVMLAMYGERFTQKALHRFNDYQDPQDKQQSWLLDNKIDFLRHIDVLTRDRATAFDYTQGEWRGDGAFNRAGIHAKIAILLALPLETPPDGLCHALQHHNMRLVSMTMSRQQYQEAVHRLLELAGQDEGARGLPPADPFLLPALLLVQAVRLDNYHLSQNSDGVSLWLQLHDGQPHRLLLGTWPDQKDALAMRQQLHRFMCWLNKASEGFYLVEHVLLRPRDVPAEKAETARPDFYSHRLSVVFPGWSARFCNPDFRRLAQETVCRNLPAHVYPDFCWLDMVAMRDFEQRHRAWRKQLQQCHREGGGSALDTASASLARFLQRQQRGTAQPYWV